MWFDALLNYTSALTYARPGEDLTDRYWPARWQLLAKDILKFHAVIWPAMLLGAGYALPRQLLIHGYLTVRDEKMSKTKGNVLDPFRVIEHYGLDALRYYLLRDVRFGRRRRGLVRRRARALPRRPRQRPRQPRQRARPR